MVLCTGVRENTANVWTRLFSSKTGFLPIDILFLHGKYADTRFPHRDPMHGLFPFALLNKDSTSHLGAPTINCAPTTVPNYNCVPYTITVPHYNYARLWTMPYYELCPISLWTVPHYYCAPLWTVPHYELCPTMNYAPLWTVPHYELCPTALWTVPHYYCAPLWTVPYSNVFHFHYAPCTITVPHYNCAPL